MSVKKLTSGLLRNIIEEEIAKFGKVVSTEERAKKTEEVDADEFADSLEKHIDYVKALKIEESRITKRLKRIREAKAKAIKKIANTL